MPRALLRRSEVGRASQSRSREGPEKSQLDQGTPAGKPDKSWYGTGKAREGWVEQKHLILC